MERLGYRPALDGIRAVAISLVVGLHVFGFPVDGGLGVDLFFVLSGFLITTLLLEERDRTGRVSFLGFYRRRTTRLMPALIALLVVYMLGSMVAGRRPEVTLLRALVGVSYTTNLPFIEARNIPAPGLAHLWTLAAEEQFYLVWPVLMVLSFRARRAPAILAASLTVLAGLVTQVYLTHHNPSHEVILRLFYGPDLRSPNSLLIGCIAGLIFVSPRREWLDWGARRLLVPALAVLVTLTFLRPVNLYGGWITLYAAAAAVLLVRALDRSSAVARILSLKWLVFLGRISYGLYLWHLLIAVSLNLRSDLPSQVAAVALSLAAATASYYLVEQPVSRRVRARFTATHVPAAATS